MSQLAIIGAGISGTAAAWALRASELDVAIFEKSRGFAGRATTRRRDGLCFDHGANYFKTDAERVERIVREELPTADLVDIGKAVWPFDQDGTLQQDDSASNLAPKWTYREGINTLGKLLVRPSGATVHLQTRVHHLEENPAGWTLVSTDGDALGTFAAVLLTPPAPQSAELLAASRMDTAVQDTLVDGLRAAAYRSQLTLILGYEQTLERPGDFYALVNADGGHDIAWLSFEEDKPGHVPDGQSVLIVQMAPDWSTEHYDAPLEALELAVPVQASDLLGTDASAPGWTDLQRWRYALPDRAADTAALEKGRGAGLFFAGDSLAGEGRVARALETGLDAAEALHAQG